MSERDGQHGSALGADGGHGSAPGADGGQGSALGDDDGQWSTEEVVEWVAGRLRFEAFLRDRSTWPTAVKPAPAPTAEPSIEEPPASVA